MKDPEGRKGAHRFGDKGSAIGDCRGGKKGVRKVCWNKGPPRERFHANRQEASACRKKEPENRIRQNCCVGEWQDRAPAGREEGAGGIICRTQGGFRARRSTLGKTLRKPLAWGQGRGLKSGQDEIGVLAL